MRPEPYTRHHPADARSGLPAFDAFRPVLSDCPRQMPKIPAANGPATYIRRPFRRQTTPLLPANAPSRGLHSDRTSTTFPP